MSDRNGYVIVITIVAPYRPATDIVLPPKRGDIAFIRMAIGQPAFDALLATPTELGGTTAVLDAPALMDRMRSLEARTLISQIDGFDDRKGLKGLRTALGDDERVVVLARYERAPSAGYAPPRREGPITPTPFRAGG